MILLDQFFLLTFYSLLRVCLVKYNISFSTDALIAAIRGDIEEAEKALDLPEHQKLKDDNFFQMTDVSSMANGH